MDVVGQITGIAALADPVRRALYAFVSAQPQSVGREAAAHAVAIPVHTAKFHLDRMVVDGLLEVEYRRTSGRSGPGAGRPAKLYRRSGREFAVSLPERRYDLAGHILARAVELARSGEPMDTALHTASYSAGQSVKSAARVQGSELSRLSETLAGLGYEPSVTNEELALANCPFDALAREHTAVVCGLNESYIQGIADGLGCTSVRARLAPTPGQCCVVASTQT